MDSMRNLETYIVSMSGGKDSTATALWALEHLPRERLQFVFCDTGAEWPETYNYLGYLERELGIQIDRIQAGDRPLPPRVDGKERVDAMANTSGGLFDLARVRGAWPMARYRFCTSYLKRWPLRLYAAEYVNPVQITGCRAEESKSRANYAWLDDSLNNKVGSPFLPPAPLVCHPILNWSEHDVWEYLRQHSILPNPVYNYATRCGCWCCIMGKKREVLNFCRLHPEIAQQAADLEQEIGHTWRPRWSITNLLREAQAQMQLFEPQPRFAEVAEY